MRRFPPGIRKMSPQIFCDICGEDCRKEGDYDSEYAELTATWGYDSRKDGDQYHVDMCENCFDKTIEFLKTIRSVNPVEKLGLDALIAKSYLPE
jgi:hypothetical protein